MCHFSDMINDQCISVILAKRKTVLHVKCFSESGLLRRGHCPVFKEKLIGGRDLEEDVLCAMPL